ncbi:Uncharacterised protein [Mycobacteroides abscessus subsp. abscessus]|jgi:hypothetical protein|nr:Uncharacterised protein [Mycobacteroides abscessus subsp. abscessus]
MTIEAALDGCTTHKGKCLSGRPHRWGIGYFDLDGVRHTATICSECSGTCDAELRLDGVLCSCGTDPHQPGRSPFGRVQ